MKHVKIVRKGGNVRPPNSDAEVKSGMRLISGHINDKYPKSKRQSHSKKIFLKRG